MEANRAVSSGPQPNRLIRFGAFELCLDTGELRKRGLRVRLQGKPFHILAALIEQPGHLVTREKLRERLWSSDTFVDFESGLNTAVNRLRSALGDSAENPVYIETLARLGYRFIAEVEIVFGEKDTEVRADVPSTNGKRGASLALMAEVPTPAAPKRPIILYALLATTVLVAAGFAIKRSFSRPNVAFQQITFQKGNIERARFSHDGKKIFYSAQWNGDQSRVFEAATGALEARAIPNHVGALDSVGPSGELAIYPDPEGAGIHRIEILSRSTENPREIGGQTTQVDFGPRGELCRVVRNESEAVIEYPSGHRIYSTKGWISDIRVSPQGNHVAFAEHPMPNDDEGRVVVVDVPKAHARVLSPGWESLEGVAWHVDEQQIWFTAARAGVDRSLRSVDLRGNARVIAELPGALLLQDISPDGKVLVTEGSQRVSLLEGNADTSAIQDISWFDWSRGVGITADSKYTLFDESGAGGGKQYSVFVYARGEKAPKRISDGRALDISADGEWVLTQSATDADSLSVHSLKNGTTSPLQTGGISVMWARFIPRHQEILMKGNYPNREPELFRQAVPDGLPMTLHVAAPVDDMVIDPSGAVAIGAAPDCRMVILDLTDNRLRFIARQQGYYPAAVLNANEALIDRVTGHVAMVDLLDLRTGRTRPYRRLNLPNPTGSEHVMQIHFAADEKTFVYSSAQALSNLFLVSGWK